MNKLGGTHLSKQNRNIIRDSLSTNKTCHEIALLLGKDERTISKEVKNRRNKQSNGRDYMNRNDCECKSLTRFPYVCNGCNKRNTFCKKYKYLYDSDLAHENYLIKLSSSREGIDMTLEDKIKLDSILKNGIDKGQSSYHVVTSNPDEIKCSVRTIYHYIDKGETIVQNIDLRRKVKLKPRKHYKQKNKDSIRSYICRFYFFFLSKFWNRNC